MWPLFLAAATFLSAQSPIGILISEQSRATFNVQGAGARAMGLGGAFIAVSDDASAVSFNPAGLAQLLKPEVSFVGRGLSKQLAFDSFETTTHGRVKTVSDSLAGETRFDPLLVSGTLPLKVNGHSLVLQLSIQRQFALSESSDRDLTETDVTGGPPALVHQRIDQSGQIDVYSFALAYEASERILVGASYNQWRGRWNLDSFSSKQLGSAGTFADFHQANSLDGGNFNLGLIWRWPTWSFGLVRRTPFHADYSFGNSLSTNAAGIDFKGSAPQPFGLHWPSTTGLGFAWRPTERWLFTTDLQHTLWSQARYMTPVASLNNLSFFDLDKSDRTPDVTSFNAGMEYLRLTKGGSVIPLRFGLSREPQPLVDRITHQQRVIFSAALGTGLKRGNTSIDVAYRYSWNHRDISQFLDVDELLRASTVRSLGTERLEMHRLDVSFIYQFERQPLERLLRHLFVGD